MKFAHLAGAVFIAAVVAAPTMAAPEMQPPMDGFNNAFYTCEKDRSFSLSYDSDHPTSVTMTTNVAGGPYVLKRAQSDSGVKFSSDSVQFWTDGSSVVVKGTDARFDNCKRKSA